MDEITTACALKRYKITKKDLPLSCPMPGMTLWNAHPKVFLKLDAKGEANCPYCSSVYELTADASDRVSPKTI